jgi:salicylate hydroxylase
VGHGWNEGDQEVFGAKDHGTVVLRSGEERKANLLVAADGLKSVVKSVVIGDLSSPTATGLSAFRFLMDTEALVGDERLGRTLKIVL